MFNIVASIITAAIIIGFASYQYQKGTFLKAFAMIIILICASAVAFNYFETLANTLIIHSDKPRYPALLDWAQMLSFVLIFILSFSIMQTILMELTKSPTDFGPLAEKVGKIICGALGGLLMAGIFLTAVGMAPISVKYPYGRFEEVYADIEKPRKALLNADGFAAGWFSLLSNGSFKSERSFAALHPNFINEIYLNRLRVQDKITVIAQDALIVLPKKDAVRIIEENLKQATDPNKTMQVPTGYKFAAIKIGIDKAATELSKTFTFSQIKLICKPKDPQENAVIGKGMSIYPMGYLKTQNLIEDKQPGEAMTITPEEFGEDSIKWFDFVFQIPNDYSPVLIGYKQNKIALLPLGKSASETQETTINETPGKK